VCALIALQFSTGRQFRVEVAVLLLTGTALSAAAAEQGSMPEFPFQNGWFGADGAYSILLATGETLWLFDDTRLARLIRGKNVHCKAWRRRL